MIRGAGRDRVRTFQSVATRALHNAPLPISHGPVGIFPLLKAALPTRLDKQRQATPLGQRGGSELYGLPGPVKNKRQAPPKYGKPRPCTRGPSSKIEID